MWSLNFVTCIGAVKIEYGRAGVIDTALGQCFPLSFEFVSMPYQTY